MREHGDYMRKYVQYMGGGGKQVNISENMAII